MSTEQELHRRLSELTVDWPREVDTTPAVMNRIEVSRRWPLHLPPRRLAPIAVALVAVALSVALLAPGPRAAIARLLGFPGIAVERTTGPLPELTGIDLGQEVTLEAAEARGPDLGTLPLPEQGVFLDERTGAVHIAYRLDTGGVALLTQLRGAEEPVFVKQSSEVFPAEVNGAFALWVTGSAHAVLKLGEVRDEARLAENALLWSAGDVTYRLEADIELPEAIRLAERVR